MYEILSDVFWGGIYNQNHIPLVRLHPSVAHHLRRLSRPLANDMEYQLWTLDNSGTIGGVLSLYFT